MKRQPEGGVDLLDEQRLQALRNIGAGAEDPSFTRLIDSFLDDAYETLDEMRHAAVQQDSDSLSSLAHRLRGSAALFGAVGVAAACDLIRSRATEAVADDLAAIVEELAETLDRTQAALAQELS